MSYDIRFKVKVEGIDYYIDTYECEAETTCNARHIIMESTGLEWKNEENNGLCKDIIPHIQEGLKELIDHPEKYKHLESPNRYWGTVDSTIRFFKDIIYSWEYLDNSLKRVATFWIE